MLYHTVILHNTFHFTYYIKNFHCVTFILTSYVASLTLLHSQLNVSH